jgi:hypothetical protein
MSKYGKMRSRVCREEVEHSAEWAVSKELIKANKRLCYICTASNIIWAIAVLILVFIR